MSEKSTSSQPDIIFLQEIPAQSKILRSKIRAFPRSIKLIGAQDTRSETLVSLFDTGSTSTSAPESTFDPLGIRRENQIRLTLANGEVGEYSIGEVVAEMDGVRRTTVRIFGLDATQLLIGTQSLEAFLLVVDPVEQRLIPTEALWL